MTCPHCGQPLFEAACGCVFERCGSGWRMMVCAEGKKIKAARYSAQKPNCQAIEAWEKHWREAMRSAGVSNEE